MFTQLSASPSPFVNSPNSSSNLLAGLNMSSNTNTFQMTPNPMQFQTNPNMTNFNNMHPLQQQQQQSQNNFPQPNYGGNHFNPVMSPQQPAPFQNNNLNASFAGMNLLSNTNNQFQPQNPMFNQNQPQMQPQQQRPPPGLPPFQQRPPVPGQPSNNQNNSLNSIEVPW